ncbi:unnamed protein product [Ranitomeya imitator]|uniref:C2 domain-containing protein n=1 Tax=Ranitomeya imitator TaxID=111125 RepID=A0ABN9L3J5_9NEOB|nr:unnamed protein product [Ranitomeya imitator]
MQKQGLDITYLSDQNSLWNKICRPADWRAHGPLHMRPPFWKMAGAQERRRTVPGRPGDVNVGMVDRNGQLEVEVIQARGLTPKSGAKTIPVFAQKDRVDSNVSGFFLPQHTSTRSERQGGQQYEQPLLTSAPLVSSLLDQEEMDSIVSSHFLPQHPNDALLESAPYIKVYLIENGACLSKKKTRTAKKTWDPVYQQVLQFDEGPQGKVLQVIVWGDYGRMDHKCFMGMAQILLEELDLSSCVTGWYKLFPTSSLADSSIAPLTRRLSQSSLESSTSPSCT